MFALDMSKQPQVEQSQDKQIRFIDSRKNEQRVGLSRWTIWRMETDGKFPKSIKVGGKRLWIESEVEAWMAARIAERG
jgi:prophage regulatory protein